MSPEQFTRVWSHLNDGAELSVRNQDGWWGLRGSAQGVVVWSRTPYEQAPPDRVVSAAEARAMIGGWDGEEVCALLSPPLAAPLED